MKVHITNLYGQSPLSVALMSQNMVADIARDLQFKEIGIYHFNADGETRDQLAIRFDGMNAAVGNGDVVVFQYPSWNGLHFDAYYLERLSIYAHLKKIIFVHDIPPLMFSSNYYLMERTIQVFNQADVLIVPSQKMLRTLREQGLTTQKVLIQNIWDHVTQAFIERPAFRKVINFAGEANRFPFVREWGFSCPLALYGSQSFETDSETIVFHGWKFKDELLMSLNRNGGFGLVWPQGEDSDYYTQNISYKLSTYLAAGLPVIIPRSLSNASLVADKGLGIVVDTLEEAIETLEKLTEMDYQKMVDRVMSYRKLLVNGYTTKRLLIDSVMAALES